MSFSILNEFILSIILGVVQGITEFIPISSTAHILLIADIFTGKDIGLATSNFIQFGTLIAIIQFYWLDLRLIINRLFTFITNPQQISVFFARTQRWIQKKTTAEDEQNGNTDIQIAQISLATIPVIISALLLRNYVEYLRTDIGNVAIFLLIGAVLIFVAETVYLNRQKTVKNTKNSDGNKEENTINKSNISELKETPSTSLFSFVEVMTIGFFQALAVFPGMSRSGSTLAGALLLGRNRAEAVRFSFLLSIPALTLASLYDLVKLISSFSNGTFGFLPTAAGWGIKEINLSVVSLLIGFALAYIVGFACLKWLLTFLAKNTSMAFIVYRILLASAIFAAILNGIIK